MSDIARIASSAPPRDQHAELRRLSHQMEALFLNQLFQVMRQSTQVGGLVDDASEGEDVFTGLLDEKLSESAAQSMTRGIGEALYRQLSRRLTPDDPTRARTDAPHDTPRTQEREP